MRFYTYPPDGYNYLFVLRNIKQKPILCEHEIVDIGIYDLLKPPHKHSFEKLHLWQKLQTTGWKVVPDVPDVRQEFNIEIKIKDNIQYSKELALEYYDERDSSLLLTIQGYYNNPGSFKEYCLWIIDNFGEPAKLSIGTVCKLSNKQSILAVFKIARSFFPKSWLHAFGLRVDYLDIANQYIDSFDSMAWIFPRGRGRASCKNKIEREQYLTEYLSTIEKYKSSKDHSLFDYEDA